MKSAIKALLVFSLGALASTTTIGGEISYRCEVRGMAEIAGDGTVHVLPGEGWVGTKFEINRKTGDTRGFGVIPTHSPVAVDAGSPHDSFRIVWKIGQPLGADYEILKIREWQVGRRKVFSFVSGDSFLYTGICD